MVSVQKKRITDYLYSERAKEFVFALFLGCLFIFGVRYGYGLFDDAQKVFPIMAVFAVYYFFEPERKVAPFDWTSLMLVISFFLMGVFEFMTEPLMTAEYDTTSYAWVVPTSYFLGKMIVGNSKKVMDRRVYIVLLVMAFGMFVQGVLNYHGISTGLRIKYTWAHSFWYHLQDGTRNTWDTGFAMIWGALYYAVLKRKENKSLLIGVVITGIVTLGFNVYYEGRTGFLVVVLVFLILSLFHIFNGNYDVVKKYKKIVLRAISVILVLVCGIYFVIRTNVAGIGKLYAESFLNRDGGIIHNVRFALMAGGLKSIFVNQKGGWTLDDSYILPHTHNSWLEYGRNYDVIVFTFLAIFLIFTIINDVSLLNKYSQEYSIVYFVIGTKIPLFLLSMVNPDLYRVRDLIIFYVFHCGITSGMIELIESGDYGSLGWIPPKNRYRYTVPTAGIFIMTMIANAYLDWWKDSLVLMTAFVLPIIVFFIGASFEQIKNHRIILIGFAVVVAIVGIYTREFEFWIIPISMLLAVCMSRFKINKILASVFLVICIGIVSIPFVNDGRIGVIKEVIKIVLNTDIGTSWLWSPENHIGLTTSYNMWLEFTRDYGVLTAGLLGAFEICTLICFIKVVFNSNKTVESYFAIVSFIMFNFYFMFEAKAFYNMYIFATGMFVYGMITYLAGKEKSVVHR